MAKAQSDIGTGQITVNSTLGNRRTMVFSRDGSASTSGENPHLKKENQWHGYRPELLLAVRTAIVPASHPSRAVCAFVRHWTPVLMFRLA